MEDGIKGSAQARSENKISLLRIPFPLLQLPELQAHRSFLHNRSHVLLHGLVIAISSADVLVFFSLMKYSEPFFTRRFCFAASRFSNRKAELYKMQRRTTEGDVNNLFFFLLAQINKVLPGRDTCTPWYFWSHWWPHTSK